MNNLTAASREQKIQRGLKKRHRAERRFRIYGASAIIFGLMCVFLLFADIISKGHKAFILTYINLEVVYDQNALGVDDPTDDIQMSLGDFHGAVKAGLRNRFSDVSGRKSKRELYSIISNGAGYELRDNLRDNPALLNKTIKVWLIADDDIDTYYKSLGDKSGPFKGRMTDNKEVWLQELMRSGDVETRFNFSFFTQGDSREPELAGIRGAAMGSFYTLVITILLAFPLGVAAAVYLEEFAPRNRWTDLIEVNINNLAAVPSIIFGLLGLAVFINFFHVPRSVPLVGGLVLTLMTLPTIIISSRAAIKSVPPSIREAAIGVGASPMQVVLHHVLPLAMPGMLTGAIIGMARALGETAPLLMIGMVAFIVDIPNGFTDPATALPVQIFLWADSPERAFVEKTSAAIMVLLAFLVVMNTFAVVLRKRLERKWS